jgi:hypothetical protein
MTPKIIELIIQDGDEEAGLDGIALVEMPAHEANFEYFNEEKETPCEDGKCSHYILAEEKIPQVIQMFHAFGEPQGFLEKEGWEITAVRPVKKQEFQIISNPNLPSAQDTPNVRFRYKYVGPKDEKNRTFCAEMMAARRVFRIEDIIEMSNRSVNEVGPDGYDIFTWRGSYNCRHRWVQLIYEPTGRIVNNDRALGNVEDEDGMPGPDTRTTATINAGNTPPRVGFAASNPDVSALSPYVDQITKPKKKPVLASLPLFEKQEDAEAIAMLIGCEGSHPHSYGDKTLFMPCKAHPKEDTSYITDDSSDPDDVGGSDNPMENFAEVGPRGGINPSDKAPKSGTPNPNPKGEGTAKGDASGKRGAKVSAEQEKTLQKKVDDFNEKESNTKNGRATLGALKSVFQRGLGAFNVSHSPKVQSSEQWAYARVNAFLYLLKNGRPQNRKYTTDNDLLPKDHPKAEKMSSIEEDFSWEGYIDEEEQMQMMRQEFQSYDDYPELISKNAQAALNYIEKTGNPNDCLTQVGKVRAQQLAQGKPISIDTVKRMKSFISRHKVDLETSKSYQDGCGKLALDAWGGVEALSWVESTIKKYEEMSIDEKDMSFSVFSLEEKMVVGPAMVPDKMIIRRNEITGEIYYVYFTEETIKKLQQKFMIEKLLDKTNVEHGRKFLNGVSVVESWIVDDPQYDKQQVFGMNYPKGTWMVSMKIEDDAIWNKIKEGKLNGYSVQGYFLEKAKFNKDTTDKLEEIKTILKQIV